MAVYTHVPTEALASYIGRYGIDGLVSAKGIAEGVENSNYLLDTTAGRFFLTLYEKRVDAGDLPFFIALLDHLSDAGLPVPRILPDRSGVHVHELAGRPACLIAYLPGVSPTVATPAQAAAAGAAMARMHGALADMPGGPDNALGLAGWHALADELGDTLNDILPGLAATVAQELATLDAGWPHHLPRSVIHADLFPDNVLMLGDQISGLIDFYFACRDITAYDLAVMHGAWAFSPDGTHYDRDVALALTGGYLAQRPLSAAERDAFPTLARGAALRFLLTRAYDWLHTPATALVARKDPLAYLARLNFLRTAAPSDLLSQ